MAKRATPKKKTAKSTSSRRYAAFKYKSIKKLEGLVMRMKSIVKKTGGSAPKKTVTKVKA